MQAVRTVGRVVRESSGPERAAQVALVQSRGVGMVPVAIVATASVAGSSHPGHSLFDIASPVPPTRVVLASDPGESWNTWMASMLARAGGAMPSSGSIAGAAVIAAAGAVVGYLVARWVDKAEERRAKPASAIVFRTQGNQALAVSSEPDGDGDGSPLSPAHLHVGVCTVCFDAPCNTIFAPCGHMCTCASCADQLSGSCPLCRSEIMDRIVIREIKA